MNFKLLNDTICGEPRLVAIVDDMDKSLETTTRAVFPAARICMDTQNDRNRMIVLIDHASDAVKKIAENFFMKPNSKVTTRVVAVPYTEALRAEKPDAKDAVSDAKEENAAPVQEVAANPEHQEDIIAKDVEEVRANAAEVQDEAKEPPKEEIKCDSDAGDKTVSKENASAWVMNTEQEEVKAQPTQTSKKRGSWEIVWKDNDAVKGIMTAVFDKYKIFASNAKKDDPVSRFYSIIKENELGNSIMIQLNWIDALGMYGVTKKSATALQAANAMLLRCSKKKDVYLDGKQTLQNFAWLSSGLLKKRMKQQKVEDFSAAYDQMEEDEKKELVRQIMDEVKKDLQTKAEGYANS